MPAGRPSDTYVRQMNDLIEYRLCCILPRLMPDVYSYVA